MNYLVIGGSGFVGSAIVAQLLARNESVRVFDVNPHPDSRVDSIQGDIRDQEQVAAACQDIDVVFQTVAIVDWSPGQSRRLYDINVTGNRHVLSACLVHQVSRLIYTSSIDVVFDGHPIVNGNESLPYPKRHLDYYGYTKTLAEQDVLMANGHHGLATCALRLAGVYGPGDQHRFPVIIKTAQAGQMVRLGSGRSRFNHVYIENAAHAHILAADRLQIDSPLAGQAYFIVDHPASNFYAFFDPYLAALGLPRPSRTLPAAPMLALAWLLETAYRLRPGSEKQPPLLTRYVVLSTCRDFFFTGSKAAHDLDYQPIVSTEEAFNRTLAWLKEEII